MGIIKVQPGSGPSLCVRCRHGQVVERRTGTTLAYCNLLEPMAVPTDIVKCTDFVDASQPTRHELEAMAWTLRHDRSGRVRGFEPPRKKTE